MAQVRDVVCGMTVDSETAQYKSEYKGETYYFCSPGCKRDFDKEPEKYLRQADAGHGAHH
jgi:Cu+-exporting ATPase